MNTSKISSILTLVGLLCFVAISSMAQPIGFFDGAQDIGTPDKLGADGSSSYDGTTSHYIVNGSGDDVWNAADAFQYVWKPWSGDFVLTANVSVTGGLDTQVWIKSMLMARQDLTPGAAHICTRIRRDGEYSMQWRAIGDDTNSKGSTPAASRKIIPQGAKQKLERQGNLFTTSYLDEAGQWVVIESHEVVMTDPIYVGLGVTAHDIGQIATGTFSNVVLAKPIAGPMSYSTDIGEPDRLGAAGSAMFADGVYTIEGSGDDVWNEKDAFHYVFTEWTGDFDVIAKVGVSGGLETQAWIKTMIMVRQDTSPGAAHICTRIRRDGQFSMQWRAASYDTNSKSSTAGDKRPVIPNPSLQRFVKQGNLFTTMYQNTAGEWITVDAYEVVFAEPFLLGFGVTAHDIGQIATGTVSDIVIEAGASSAGNWQLFQ